MVLFVLTKTCMKTGAKGLFAIGSLLYISYSKNKTTILWLVDGSRSGCCRSISCNQQQQQNDTEIVALEQAIIILSWQLIVQLSGVLRRTVFLVLIDFWQPVGKSPSESSDVVNCWYNYMLWSVDWLVLLLVVHLSSDVISCEDYKEQLVHQSYLTLSTNHQ